MPHCPYTPSSTPSALGAFSSCDTVETDSDSWYSNSEGLALSPYSNPQFNVMLIFFFAVMPNLLLLIILLYFVDVNWHMLMLIDFIYISMCFSSMFCKQEMFAFIRWFAAETEIFRMESPCRPVSMPWPHYDSLCKWLYLRRICVGLSTMVPQAFHLHFFAKQSCEGKILYSLYSLRSTEGSWINL